MNKFRRKISQMPMCQSLKVARNAYRIKSVVEAGASGTWLREATKRQAHLDISHAQSAPARTHSKGAA